MHGPSRRKNRNEKRTVALEQPSHPVVQKLSFFCEYIWYFSKKKGLRWIEIDIAYVSFKAHEKIELATSACRHFWLAVLEGKFDCHGLRPFGQHFRQGYHAASTRVAADLKSPRKFVSDRCLGNFCRHFCKF